MSANQKRHLKPYNNHIYFGELEFEPDAIFKFMTLLCKSQLHENESQVAYIASHMFHEFRGNLLIYLNNISIHIPI